MTVPKEQEQDIESLRETWKTLYTQTLPSLAKSKSPSQPKWPVTLDHCFARIILDNTIGNKNSSSKSDEKDAKNDNSNCEEEVLVPWDTVISRPAVKNMSAQQFRDSIELGEKIANGSVDLVEFDRRSLVGRGKNVGKYGNAITGEKKSQKRKREDDSGGKEGKKQATLSFSAVADDKKESTEIAKLEKSLDVKTSLTKEEALITLRRIRDNKDLTPFRRRLYTSLLSVPRGQYTTYAALASHLNSVARAVGNGMRNNPFAPDVPCHRVLASDGTIGGFGGDWGKDGKLTGKQDEKVRLLKEEGVRFDSGGKVKGKVWGAFWDWDDFVKEYGDI